MVLRFRQLCVIVLASMMLTAQTQMVLEAQNLRALTGKTLQHTESRARAGNISAQFQLGAHYQFHEDYRQAIAWYEKAAGRGHRGAQFNLGVLYAQDKGIKKDMARARDWFRAAAERGDKLAQFNLGISYQDDNKPIARDWLGKAAAQGYAPA